MLLVMVKAGVLFFLACKGTTSFGTPIYPTNMLRKSESLVVGVTEKSKFGLTVYWRDLFSPSP
jgi:hypothetical protein